MREGSSDWLTWRGRRSKGASLDFIKNLKRVHEAELSTADGELSLRQGPHQSQTETNQFPFMSYSAMPYLDP